MDHIILFGMFDQTYFHRIDNNLLYGPLTFPQSDCRLIHLLLIIKKTLPFQQSLSVMHGFLRAGHFLQLQSS